MSALAPLRNLILTGLWYLGPTISTLNALTSAPSSGKHDPNAYACNSRVFDLRDFGATEAFVQSPDRQKRVVMESDGSFSLLIGKTGMPKIQPEEISSNIEIGWSPDSSQFFIMWSGGGAEGLFYVRIFQVERQKILELAAPRAAYNHFEKRHLCKARRANNIYMLGWTSDSQKVFLVTEVYPTSDCEESGLFRGYLIEAKTGKILKVFGEKETEVIKTNSRKAGVVLIPQMPGAEGH